MPGEENPTVVIVQGSVLELNNMQSGAIVNAANEGCLGGGGVDRAISSAGGPNLAKDRLALPVLNLKKPTTTTQKEGKEGESSDDDEKSLMETEEEDYYYSRPIRCREGSAVLTGPGDYGSLQVPYVIHAVGPNFCFSPNPRQDLELLKSAYKQSLDLAVETNVITEIAFSLLSAGVFRGPLKLSDVLFVGLSSIKAWSPPEGSKLERIYVCGFTERECAMLLKVADYVFSSSVKRSQDETENNKSKKQESMKEDQESSAISGVDSKPASSVNKEAVDATATTAKTCSDADAAGSEQKVCPNEPANKAEGNRVDVTD